MKMRQAKRWEKYLQYALGISIQNKEESLQPTEDDPEEARTRSQTGTQEKRTRRGP